MSHHVLDLERYVPALITFISNKLSSGASNLYRERYGLGITEWRVMAMLAVEPDITAARICEVIGVNKAAASRCLNALGEKSYVQITNHASDERQKLIRLTPIGNTVHDSILRVALARENKLLEPFTVDEIDQLIDFLLRMHKQVNAVNAMELTENSPEVEQVEANLNAQHVVESD